MISNFKKLFMHQVAEAKLLPERQWYLNEKDVNDEIDEEIDESDDSDGELGAETEAELQMKQITFAAFMEELVKNAKIYGQLVRHDTGNVKIDRQLRISA